MSTLAAWTDRINPIVVKEVRQGLRTRVFWICFSLMLLACAVISLVAFASAEDKGINQDGAYYFLAFFMCLGVAQFFIIPYSAYRSLAREREDETWVLLTLTGLGPRKILRGKVGSYLVQAALYGSAAGPFLLFSYYLNGIDLPTIGVLIALGIVYTVFLTSVCVCAATLAETRLFRGLIHFALLGALMFAGGLAIGAVTGLTSLGARLFKEQEFWLILVVGIWAMLSYGLLLFETAAARLALLTENYARGPRLALLLQMLGSMGMMLYVWFRLKTDSDVLIAAQIIFMLNMAGVGIFLSTDYDGQTVAQRQQTRVFSLLRPGALRGFRFTMILTGFITATLMMMAPSSGKGSTHMEHVVYATAAAGAYVVLYISLAVLLTRSIQNASWSSPPVGRVVFVFLVLIASGGPPLLALIAGGSASDPVINLFNPMVGMAKFLDSIRPWNDARAMGLSDLVALGSVSLIAAVVADRVLAARDARSP